jgi:Zn-dependent M28 family amino/carboxypeptidase
MAVVAAVAMLLSSCVGLDVVNLASDAADGRNNDTPGSTLAQNYLLAYLTQNLQGANSAATGVDAYKQPFTGGTNIVAVLPGTDLANQYVLIGAHYDHLGHNCRDLRPNDDICNGATDNAASVAAMLELAREFVAAPTAPRRSIIFAFWDREEDGLLGSKFYAQNPLRPLAQTVAYVNLDILGSNLRPSLRNLSFAVGAETGGPRLQQLVQDAITPSGLGTQLVSSIFGEARSDYVSLIGVGVPTVFFSDATGPCYHTDSDDWSVVDYGKLNKQIDILHRLLVSLTATDDLPVFTTGNPLATYADAQVMTNAIDELQADLALFTAAQQTNIVSYRTQLHAIVAAGPGAFDNTSISTTLSIAATLVGYFTTGPCSGFLQ